MFNKEHILVKLAQDVSGTENAVNERQYNTGSLLIGRTVRLSTHRLLQVHIMGRVGGDTAPKYLFGITENSDPIEFDMTTIVSIFPTIQEMNERVK